ncbi:MAG: hypothetical protein M9894_18030 [Planctomycetes bacterium]|nr:hypothetical protein [Planctomycetota bacterium]
MADDRHQIPNMNAADLYREDLFTDRAVGTIRRLTPVTPQGADDPARQVVFVGSTQLLTPAGALPLTFEIDGTSLADAVKNFAAAAEDAVRETLEELAAIRRESASGLVIPDAGALGGLGGPGLAGPGGGKLHLR